MATKIVKVVCILSLCSAFLMWKTGPAFQLTLAALVCLTAILVATEAFRAGKRALGTIFVAIAFFFNPIIFIVQKPAGLPFLLIVALIVAFSISLIAKKAQPTLSMASITGLNSGSESL